MTSLENHDFCINRTKPSAKSQSEVVDSDFADLANRDFRCTKDLKRLVMLNLKVIEKQRVLIFKKTAQVENLMQDNEALRERVNQLETDIEMIKRRVLNSNDRDLVASICSNETSSKFTVINGKRCRTQYVRSECRNNKRRLPLKPLKAHLSRRRLSPSPDRNHNHHDENDDSETSLLNCRRSTRLAERCSNSVSNDSDSKPTSLISRQGLSDLSYCPDSNQVADASPKDVAVPSWRIKTYSKTNDIEGIENIAIEHYKKMHSKLELEEQKMKKKDLERQRKEIILSRRAGRRYFRHHDPYTEKLYELAEQIHVLHITEEIPEDALDLTADGRSEKASECVNSVNSDYAQRLRKSSRQKVA